MILPFVVGPSYTSQSPNADAEECINFYVEQMESPGAKAATALYPTPGYRTWQTLVTYPNRALFECNGRAFAINGDTFYELFSTPSNTNYGVVATDTFPAQITTNGDGGSQLFLCSGNTGYCFDLVTNTLTSVMSGVKQCGFLNGYGLALDTSSSKLKVSDLEDLSTWDPTMFAQRTLGPDTWQAMATLHGEIWLIGSQTGEVWYDSGDANFPFAPIPGAFFQQGIAAAFSVARVGTSLMWLSQNEQGRAMVVRTQGYTPSRVSNHAVEYAIQGYSTVADATAFSYQDQGHEFYVLNFPTAGISWVYDANTSLWHKRGFWNAPTMSYQANRAQNHVYAFGKHLVGDRSSGALYEYTLSSVQEAGSIAVVSGGATYFMPIPIRRLRRMPHLSQEQKRIVYNSLQIDLQVGLPLQTPESLSPPGLSPESEPHCLMRYSNDAAMTWSLEREASAGATGEYRKRVRWLRLGQSRDRIFEIVMTSYYPFRLVAGYLDVTPGDGT